MSKYLERRAYHEAGHAVMSFLVEKKVGEITIEPFEEFDGDNKQRRMGPDFTNRGDYFGATRANEPDLARDYIMVLYAGRIVEEVAGFDAESRWDGRDKDTAAEIAFRLCNSADETADFLTHAWDRAEMLLRENWDAVEAVKVELLDKRTITGERAREIIRGVLS